MFTLTHKYTREEKKTFHLQAHSALNDQQTMENKREKETTAKKKRNTYIKHIWISHDNHDERKNLHERPNSGGHKLLPNRETKWMYREKEERERDRDIKV